MPKPTIYVASAGTGKTYTLMNELDKALESTTPDTIIYTTFTNAGATEAAERAIKRFPKYNELSFKFFRTMHSLANRAITSRKMMGVADFIELGKELGIFIKGS
jgi:ATP-dependent exoDNAse (exonuclease V) beta subunit